MNKREFIGVLTSLGITLPIWNAPLNAFANTFETYSPTELAKEEDFWKAIRKAYTLKKDYINLENGYYCFMPEPTLEAFLTQVRSQNREGSYYLRTKQFEDKLAVREQLATLAGCKTEELIITRNTTESIDTVIAGMDWKAGDEAIMALQDYGAMLDMFKLQARRYASVNVVLSIPNHPTSDDEIVSLYEKAITPKTKLILVSHIINITGQILPIQKICAMAHQKGVPVLVDGAHAFAQLNFKIPDLGCDYYASSLHKWLSVPLGAGLLYVKKENISKLWQLFGDSSFADDDIRKLNHTGTHPVHTDLTIPAAIQFHQKIGTERKEARLRYLQEYWTQQVRDLPNIVLNTPKESQRACAIANVGLTNYTPAKMAKTLLETYKIWTVAIDHPTVKGCRITPNVYTSTQELDTLVQALKTMSK